jgi:hypothetical protein
MSILKPITGATLLVLSALSLNAQNAPAGCRPDFVAATSYTAASSILGVAAIDMNGDGRPDLITTAQSYQTALSVRLGQPDGSLGPAIEKDTNDYPYASVVGLFTNDSDPDIVVANSVLRLYKGNGDGSLQDPVLIDPNLYSFVQSGDVNGDGKADLVALGYFNGEIDVFLGNGDGTFQPPVSTPNDFGIFTPAIGDVNGDGKADIVAPTGGPSLKVYLSNGDGTFAPPADVVLGAAMAVTLADVTSDGVLDILAIVNGSLVGVLVGNGDGTFQAAVLYDAGPAPTAVLAADIDGDGLADLAVSSAQMASVWILRGLPSGGFGPPAAYGADYGAHYLAAADFGLDGRLDLVAGSDSIARVSLLRGDGSGDFRSARISGGFEYGQIVAQGDYNEDGLPDIAVVEYYGGLQILLGNGDATFALGPHYDVGVNSPSGLVAADFDGNGHLDLAILSTYFGQIQVLLGTGDGHFGAPIPADAGSGDSYFNFLAAGHFTGQTQTDLLVVAQQNSGAGDLIVLPGFGNGFFGPPIVTPITQGSGFGLAADLNGDGFTDLVLANANSNLDVQVFRAVGDGTFLAPDSYAFGFPARTPIAAHLHDGGPVDVVIPADSQSLLEILTGNGDGTFKTPTLVGLGTSALSVAAADFNTDGHVDLVLANSTADASILLGLGNGAFLSPTTYSIGPGAGIALTGDYDDDGLVDAAFISGSNFSTVGVLRNGGLSGKTHNDSVIVGSPALLHVSADGSGPLTYQWRKNGVPVSDGGPISGATTATLTIDPAAFSDAGSYDVLLTDSCGSIASNAAALAVEFDDVPLDDPFHADILTIATAGITTGCTDTSFCPSNPVSRAEMAVFLLKSKLGADHVPPPPPPVPIYPDVPADVFAAAWIDELATLEITTGCGGGLYCPDRPVSRAEMAVFLLKTLLGSGYVPPTPAGIFADVPLGSFAVEWIEDLYNHGVTAGCATNPLRYCPDAIVPREQMATFLVRTFLGP